MIHKLIIYAACITCVSLVLFLPRYSYRFLDRLLLWSACWFIFGYLIVFFQRNAGKNYFYTICAGLFTFAYAACFSMALISLYNVIAVLEDPNYGYDLTAIKQWLEKFYPILIIVFYTLPLAFLVVLIRKLNYKHTLFYIVFGLAAWFHITGIRSGRHYSIINRFIPLYNGVDIYQYICQSSYWRPFDKSLSRRIDEREKKNAKKLCPPGFIQ